MPKAVLKDVLKFMLWFTALQSLMIFLAHIYTYFSLDTLKMDVNDVLFGDEEDISVEGVFGRISSVTNVALLLPMPLALFYTFFSSPPKGVRHMLGCTFVIAAGSLIINFLLHGLHGVFNVLITLIYIWMPWLCSVFRQRISDKKS